MDHIPERNGDVVVTVPKGLWAEWLREGDLAGEEWGREDEYHFWVSYPSPFMVAGDRVYIVAHGKLRGYAPLVRREVYCKLRPDRSCLVRRNDAVAVTIDEPIRGFQGWRRRWWEREDEHPFTDWRTP